MQWDQYVKNQADKFDDSESSLTDFDEEDDESDNDIDTYKNFEESAIGPLLLKDGDKFE